MARSGWSTSNFLRLDSAVVTAAPMSIAVWAKTSATATVQCLALVSDSGVADHSFRMYIGGGDNIIFGTFAGASVGAALTSTTIAANTWFSAIGVTSAANSRAVYLNAAGKGTDTTAATPSGLNRTSIGVFDLGSATSPIAPSGTGLAAEVAIYNAALSDNDAASLSKGIHPFLVRPDALVAYWPLLGYYSPEINLKSNTATMAIQGSLSQAAHCRVFYPAQRGPNPKVAAAALRAKDILVVPGTSEFGASGVVVRRNPVMIAY